MQEKKHRISIPIRFPTKFSSKSSIFLSATMPITHTLKKSYHIFLLHQCNLPKQNWLHGNFAWEGNESTLTPPIENSPSRQSKAQPVRSVLRVYGGHQGTLVGIDKREKCDTNFLEYEEYNFRN